MYKVSEQAMKTPLGDPELKMAIVRRVGTVHWRPDFDRISYLRSVTG